MPRAPSPYPCDFTPLSLADALFAACCSVFVCGTAFVTLAALEIVMCMKGVAKGGAESPPPLSRLRILHAAVQQ